MCARLCRPCSFKIPPTDGKSNSPDDFASDLHAISTGRGLRRRVLHQSPQVLGRSTPPGARKSGIRPRTTGLHAHPLASTFSPIARLEGRSSRPITTNITRSHLQKRQRRAPCGTRRRSSSRGPLRSCAYLSSSAIPKPERSGPAGLGVGMKRSVSSSFRSCSIAASICGSSPLTIIAGSSMTSMSGSTP